MLDTAQPHIRLENYSLAEFVQNIQAHVQKGYVISLENSDYPQGFSGHFTVGMVLATTEAPAPTPEAPEAPQAPQAPQAPEAAPATPTPRRHTPKKATPAAEVPAFNPDEPPAPRP